MENHPQIAFDSTAVEQVDPEHYRVSGDLTIKGVTKPVSVDLEFTGSAVDPFGNHRIGLEGRPPSTARTGASAGTRRRGRRRPGERERDPRVRVSVHPRRRDASEAA